MPRHAPLDLTLAILSEPALKGLAYEARRRAARDGGRAADAGGAGRGGGWTACDPDLAADGAGRLIRGGAGLALAGDARRATQEVETVAQRCQGKAAAEVAARRLLAAHAHHLSADVTVEAEVLTEHEWMPVPREED